MIETWLKCDLTKPVRVVQLTGNLFSGDVAANKIGVVVTDGGEPATLSGSVMGYIIRADGATVTVTGELDDNKVWIVLPESAYIVIGQANIVIKLGTTTLGACTGYVYRTTTDTLVDPGSVVPDISELLALIGDCETATTAATSAASAANTAAGAINNMTVSATALSRGSTPTATISDVSGHKHITFGLPATSEATLVSGDDYILSV